jgi:hypothetical protein
VTRVTQTADRFVDPFGRQLERAEVHADALRRLELEMCLDRFRRIHVHGVHEPARLVRADRNQRQIDRPEPLANVAKDERMADTPYRRRRRSASVPP